MKLEEEMKMSDEQVFKAENAALAKRARILEFGTAYSNRRRVNVKTNAKGELQWEATVEMYDCSNEEIEQQIQDLKRRMIEATK